jgi:hypothetical protein
MTTNKRLRKLLVFILSASIALFASACDQGNTGGGTNNTTPGAILVADGGFGGTLSIEITGDLSVGGTVGFFVRAFDPNGAPYEFIRIFCESERGIAILEPSSGGVAFESTDQSGTMSGVLGGVAPGSYILECRGPVGFQLVDRVSIIITGDTPAGFTGFPGAAGGNLGGGFIEDDSDFGDSEVFVSDVSITTLGGTVNQIDVVQNGDCDGNVMTADPEPFGIDGYSLSISNPTQSTIEIDSVSFSISELGVVSTTQLNQDTIAAGATASLTGFFTAFDGGLSKLFAGTAVSVPAGTFNVTFTIRGSFLDESRTFAVTRSVTILADNFDNCA